MNVGSKTRKVGSAVALSAVVPLVALATFGLGYGLNASMSDTSGTYSGGSISSGNVKIGNVTGDYTANVSGLNPGQTKSVTMSITNSGSLSWGKLDVESSGSGALVDNPTKAKTVQGPIDENGNATTIPATWGTPLSLSKISACTAAWSGDTCSGTLLGSTGQIPLGSKQVNNVFTSTNGAAEVLPGASVYLKYDYTLPSTAKEEYDGESANIAYRFTVTQHEGRPYN